MSLQAIRAGAEAAGAEQKRELERRRNIIILIHSHLIENGYIESAERLQHEAGNIVNKFDVADNIDLPLILNDFETYYEFRLGKKPKIVRKVDEDTKSKPPKPRAITKSNSKDIKSSPKSEISGTNTKLPSVNGASPQSSNTDENDENSNNFGIQGTTVTQSSRNEKNDKKIDNDDINRPENRILKPPPQFLMDPEMKQLAGVISREIYQDSPNVSFDDIVRLDEAKRLLKEAVQLPLRYPAIFTGILRPWKGILLHGPPGTGKTMLAKAVATECRTTFFNISASSLVSKWRGDSEKLVRALFELARHHGPSTIFLDEIDSILGARGGGDGGGTEHEASRRMKTELLVQMDGLRSGGSANQVFVMAASNLPWDLDTAVLRRLEKRVMVPLPEPEAREVMLRKHLTERAVENFPFEELSTRTEGYSGADIELLCREAAMKPVRRLMKAIQDLENTAPKTVPPPPRVRSTNSKNGPQTSGSFTGPQSGSGSVSGSTEVFDAEALLRADPVTYEDIMSALATTKPSSDGKMSKYTSWQEEYGSV